MQRDWEIANNELDFRVGGWERSAARQPGGPMHLYEARFQDIVPDQRINLSYEIFLDEKRISVLNPNEENSMSTSCRSFSGLDRDCSKISVRSTSNWNRQRWWHPLLRRACASGS